MHGKHGGRVLRLLVTGANGQLGQELAELCGSRALAATLVSKSSCDITNKEQVVSTINATRPTVIVNAAAYTQVDGAESASELSFRINRDGAKILADASATAGIPLIHFSTDYVFDGAKPAPYTEQDEVKPLGVYGRSKEAGEREVRQRHPHHVILRTAWVYGRFGRNFLKTMVTLATTRETWGVVSDQIGTPTATEDIAQAVLCVATQASTGKACWGTFHFAGSAEGSWHAFASDIMAAQEKHTGRTPKILALATKEYPTVARRPQNSRLNSDLFAATFGYRAKPWHERVPLIVDALLANGQERRQ